jgi:hypothetical protein
MAVEIAIRAFRLAKRPVDIDGEWMHVVGCWLLVVGVNKY